MPRNMFSTYDNWKLASPEDEREPREFKCERCEDEGCNDCCPPQPVELEDLDQIDDDIFAMRDEPLDPMRGVEFPFADNH